MEEGRRIPGLFGNASDNINEFVVGFVYNVSTSIKLMEVKDEIPDITTLSNLKIISPEIYRAILYGMLPDENGLSPTFN